MAVTIGRQAPEIDLPLAGNQARFKLSDYRGKQPVVLLFFPFAWTGVCTKQMCDTRDMLGQYDSLGAKVVGISADSPFALAKFKDEQGVNFDLASDFNKQAMEAFGCRYDDFNGLNGVAKRSAFVIDRDGKIAYAEINESPKDVPAFDNISAALKQ